VPSRVPSKRRAPRLERLEPRLLMATWFVLNNNDSGVGSLRQAIASAASNDTIRFNTSGSIVLASPLSIGKSLTIGNTSGPTITLLDGNLGTSLINVTSGSVNLKLQYMTLANGKTSGDG